jgi:methyl coenzyme M reductase gamma subunit
MKTKIAATALIIASTLIVATPSFAGVTREEVKAELAQAIRTGDMPAPGNRGLMLNELYPSRYPAKQAQASLTREQVKAELAEAIRTGDFMASDSGQKCNEIHPDMHPAV